MSINPIYLPLYNQYFPNNTSESVESVDWTDFENIVQECEASLSARSVDFSICDTTWVDLGKSALELTLKVIVIVSGVYFFGGADLLQRMSQILLNSMTPSLLRQSQNLFPLVMRIGNVALKLLFYSTTLRYIVQRVVMTFIYPAQSCLLRRLSLPHLSVQNLNLQRKQIGESSNEFICRDVVLEKNGVRYSGMLMGHRDTIHNGNWALQAVGNGESIERLIEHTAQVYYQDKFNILMINGPSVGKSQGTATPSTMGDAQDIGISYLETALKAKKIVIAGRSLGGAAIGLAILKHHFKKDVKYLVVQQMTFDCTSNIAAKMVGQMSSFPEWVVAKVIQVSGCEMDSVKASKKLQKEGIQEVIIQASNRAIPKEELPSLEDFITDSVIMKTASLGYALIQKGITDNKVFRCLPNEGHMTDLAFSSATEEITNL